MRTSRRRGESFSTPGSARTCVTTPTLTGYSLSDEVKKALGAVHQVHLGTRTVPVEKIVGSVGRHRDFDRAFLPSKGGNSARWKKIDALMHRAEELPPVSLYKIGDAYFVNDGNHRVSVARQQGIETVEAEVTELRSRIPVKPRT